MFKVPEKYRLKKGMLASTEADGNNGAFLIYHRPTKTDLFCIASDGAGWEHVSVSIATRCPVWEEMCFIKDTFWSREDCVVQFHPPDSEYVNNHKFCLHLWRPTEFSLMIPNSLLVGIK